MTKISLRFEVFAFDFVGTRTILEPWIFFRYLSQHALFFRFFKNLIVSEIQMTCL